MKRARLLFVLCLAFFSSYGHAEVSDWLRKSIKAENPNQLPYTAFADNCPFSTKDVESVVDGVLTRNRIKPIVADKTTISRIYMIVTIRCIGTTSPPDDHFAMHIGVRYARWLFFFLESFDAMALGEREYLLIRVEKRVEDAIAAYREANFDL